MQLKTKEIIEETLEFNFGPQHPATHGVLRLILKTSNEIIKEVEVCIGYLHRGIEKLAETKEYIQIIPLTDRLDYVSSAVYNLGFCLAVEKLLEIQPSRRANYLRVLLNELCRVASHLVWIATMPLDIGAYTVFLYAFREREKVLDIFEEYCGARMTHSCIIPSGVRFDMTKKTEDLIKKFLNEFPKRLNEYEGLLTNNPIWLKRTKNIGIITKEEALLWGLSGPNLRASGIKRDVRVDYPYAAYNEVSFDIPTGNKGDIYDRYLVRLAEMRQSIKIIQQVIDGLPEGQIKKRIPPLKGLKADEVYTAVEAPRGEMGFYIISDGSSKPYRLRIRAPSFANIQILHELGQNSFIADLVAIIGSLDPVLGEIDR